MMDYSYMHRKVTGTGTNQHFRKNYCFTIGVREEQTSQSAKEFVRYAVVLELKLPFSRICTLQPVVQNFLDNMYVKCWKILTR